MVICCTCDDKNGNSDATLSQVNGNLSTNINDSTITIKESQHTTLSGINMKPSIETSTLRSADRILVQCKLINARVLVYDSV